MNFIPNQFRRSFLFAMLLAFGAMLLAVSPASADEMSDLQARFKERYVKLSAQRNIGAVGETWDGWVEVVKAPVAADVAALVAAENTDRKALYAILAKKQNAKPEEVGEVNGTRNFKKALPDHMLKVKTGQWMKAKDVKMPA